MAVTVDIEHFWEKEVHLRPEKIQRKLTEFAIELWDVAYGEDIRQWVSFLKRVEDHVRTVAFHFMNYNLCRVHQPLKTTPAIAAGVSDKVWTLEDVIEMNNAYWEAKNQTDPLPRLDNLKEPGVSEINLRMVLT